jgi:hypothetical protein
MGNDLRLRLDDLHWARLGTASHLIGDSTAYKRRSGRHHTLSHRCAKRASSSVGKFQCSTLRHSTSIPDTVTRTTINIRTHAYPPHSHSQPFFPLISSRLHLFSIPSPYLVPTIPRQDHPIPSHPLPPHLRLHSTQHTQRTQRTPPSPSRKISTCLFQSSQLHRRAESVPLEDVHLLFSSPTPRCVRIVPSPLPSRDAISRPGWVGWVDVRNGALVVVLWLYVGVLWC